LTFQLTRELKQVDQVNQFPAKIKKLLAEGRDTSEVQQAFFDTRQALEWVIKQVRPWVTVDLEHCRGMKLYACSSTRQSLLHLQPWAARRIHATHSTSTHGF
jgi:hypothetical protein